ncbi:hypothetical protein RvY_04475 [Ramazzottius varieornatus]|uniref:Uncharacterized protein n=1 Tax=Ramazzottius varieornatus TaxID=947166 RepID=A0A1D1UV47_RAMVA|nr:hypothetical protein RvY_04475 [Ramazzottius varieornatus]
MLERQTTAKVTSVRDAQPTRRDIALPSTPSTSHQYEVDLVSVQEEFDLQDEAEPDALKPVMQAFQVRARQGVAGPRIVHHLDLNTGEDIMTVFIKFVNDKYHDLRVKPDVIFGE